MPDRDEAVDLTDTELLARTADGDTSAFRHFVARHRAAAFRVATLATRSQADAEDALQKAFLEIFRHAATVRAEGSARAYLFTLVRHAAYRQAGPSRREAPVLDDDLATVGEAAGFGADDPERALADREHRAAITAAFERLSVEDREVLVLHDLEELPGAEVAETLALTVPAMKSRLHRARLRLLAACRAEVGL